MSIYETWPDPAMRMRDLDELEIMPSHERQRDVSEFGSLPPNPEVERARKAVRVRALTDPLGAMGFRDSRARIAREGRARRLAAAGAAVTFVGSFGFIVWSSHASGAANVAQADASVSGAGAIAAAVEPTSTPAPSFARSGHPAALMIVDQASDGSGGIAPSATTTNTPTPEPTATDTPTAEPSLITTPKQSHVRSHSSG